MKPWTFNVVRLMVLGAGFCVGFAAVIWLSHEGAPPEMGHQPEEGVELALVLLVDTSCAWSNSPNLVPAWEALVENSIRSAARSNRRVTTIGIARSQDSSSGWSLLAGIGEFDQVAVGGRYNNGYLRYFGEHFRGPSNSPQVVVLEQEFIRREDGSLHRASERVIQRHFGISGIRNAAERIE